jgi:superoxide oxidase
MSTRTSAEARYNSGSIALHWLMLVLIAATFLFTELRTYHAIGTPEREAFKAAHYSFGMVIFLLIWVRIGFRIVGKTPPIEPPIPLYLKIATTGMQLALYAFMIGMPLLGWAARNAEGEAVALFGYALPAILAADHDLGEQLEEWHETIGNAGYYLIGLHALAALFHHFVRRDNTVARMLPK